MMVALIAMAAYAGGGSSCSSKAAYKTAGYGGCMTQQSETALLAIDIETVRLPSGTLAVFYNGEDADSVAYLHSVANGATTDFSCGLVKKMANNVNCSVEMATTDTGVMFLCTSDDTQLVDSFEKNYEVAMADTESADSE